MQAKPTELTVDDVLELLNKHHSCCDRRIEFGPDDGLYVRDDSCHFALRFVDGTVICDGSDRKDHDYATAQLIAQHYAEWRKLVSKSMARSLDIGLARLRAQECDNAKTKEAGR